MRTCDSNTATMRRVWRHISGYFLLAAALLLSGTSFAAGPRQPEEQVVNLMGPWKFQIGDNNAWAAPGFDDREWDKIYAPACWEDEGFAGYDGYAWYRRHFTLDEGQETGMLYLHLGEIDDVDEVYLNGRRIGGSGAFPPRFYTAYSVYRIYPLPEEYLNPGGNKVLAVRVYDSHREGGIVHGRIGIYAARPALRRIYPWAPCGNSAPVMILSGKTRASMSNRGRTSPCRVSGRARDWATMTALAGIAGTSAYRPI